jgi:exoribonuclease R
MFVISQNGRTPIDMSIEQTGDANVKIEDLKDLRNEIVSLSGVS